MQAVHLRFGFSFVLQAVLNRIYIWTYPFWAGSGLAIGLLPFVCLLDAQILLRRLGLRVLRPVSFVLFVVFVVFGFVCSSIRGGTKRTIACFDCRLQLSCSLRPSLLVLPILAVLHAGFLDCQSAVAGWLLCTCDNIFIIFASFFRSSPTVGACVNINFSRRFNPDYPLTVKFFTQNFSAFPALCLSLAFRLSLSRNPQSAIPFFHFSPCPSASQLCLCISLGIVLRLVLRDNDQRRRLLDAIAAAFSPRRTMAIGHLVLPSDLGPGPFDSGLDFNLFIKVRQLTE